jgi:DNA/RNA endonuclease YhcR with UshA esterase domain
MVHRTKAGKYQLKGWDREMKKASKISAIIACAIAAPVFASTIATVESDSSGTVVTLDQNPIITYIAAMPGTGDGYTYTRYAILANDGTGSIDLFGTLPTGSYVPTVGDAISVTGTFSPFNGIPEIGSMTAISLVTSGNSVPGPIGVTIPELKAVSTTENLAIEGYLVELDNVTLVSPPASYPVHNTATLTATDGTNNLTVFYQPSTYSVSDPLAGTAVPTGAVDITGIIDAFNGTYNGSPVGGTPELIPFTITAVPEPTSIGLLALGGMSLLARRRSAR